MELNNDIFRVFTDDEKTVARRLLTELNRIAVLNDITSNSKQRAIFEGCSNFDDFNEAGDHALLRRSIRWLRARMQHNPTEFTNPELQSFLEIDTLVQNEQEFNAVIQGAIRENVRGGKHKKRHTKRRHTKRKHTKRSNKSRK